MATNGSTAGTVLSIVTAACAVLVTSAVIHREFTSDAPNFRPRSIRDYAPVEMEDWDMLLAGGQRIGTDSASLVIVEFGDFQCPACRRFHESALAPLMKEHPADVSVVFYHWPLPYHAEAYSAARTAECAADQGQFPQIFDALFRWQDSLGHTPPEFFARAAGVKDIGRFNACAASLDSLPSVARGVALAKKVGGVGTPTLVINGQLLRYVPDSAGLSAIFDQAKKGAL